MDLYRYDYVFVSNNAIDVCLQKFRVLRETERTYFIQRRDRLFGKLTQVRKHTAKKYAHPTVVEARQCFLRRKRYELTCLSNRIAAIHTIVNANINLFPDETSPDVWGIRTATLSTANSKPYENVPIHLQPNPMCIDE